MNTHTEHDNRAEALQSAEAGARAWRRTVHAQGGARPDHGDFYALAAELVDTLRSLDSLAGVLAQQTTTYPVAVTAAGGRVYDDENAVPVHRLRSAVLALAETRQGIATAERAVNRYWSVIAHIGVVDAPEIPGGEQR